MSCGAGCRRSWDPVLLWLRHRQVATALIEPLAWEPPYAVGATLEKAKRQKKKKEKKNAQGRGWVFGKTLWEKLATILLTLTTQ